MRCTDTYNTCMHTRMHTDTTHTHTYTHTQATHTHASTHSFSNEHLLNVYLSQDRDGDTALHCAILAQKHEAARILLDANADPSLVNFNLFNCVHVAAKAGVLP